jgi:hypothetical protein
MLGPNHGKEESSSAFQPMDALSFGINANQQFLDRKSHYAVPATVSQQNRLCFDVSNNRISCSMNSHGLLERFVIQVGVAPNEA